MDTSKIIRGVVSNGRYTVTAPIVKEDYGLQLQIEGIDLPSSYQVDFSNSENSGTSVTMVGSSNKVLIPREFIETGKDIFAFLYLPDGLFLSKHELNPSNGHPQLQRNSS